MVEWKGRLEVNEEGKAEKLNNIEKFNVPNFFLITSEELRKEFNDNSSSQEILNSKVSNEFEEKVKESYKDIGMSSEVRNADGRAKNLVGGQRNNQLVSVRISKGKGHFKYKLNVGSSNLLDAIKEVESSYFRDKNSFAPIIVQKMIEPEYSGSAIIERNKPDLVEVVEGLGTSLEQGENKPYLYVRENDKIETKIPENHLKVSRNPINGEKREKKVESSLPFEKSEINDFLEKLERENVNVKFVYKRGDFYIVDAWREESQHEILKNREIQGLKVSEGDIRGTVGNEITFSDKTLSPNKYQKHLVSKRGGYTSRDAESARNSNKPAVFNFSENLKNGQRINMQENSGEKTTQKRHDERTGSNDSFNPFQDRSKDSEPDIQESSTDYLATTLMPLNPHKGKGVFTSPPFGEGYRVRDNPEGDNEISKDNYVDNYSKVFAFDGEKIILDVRKMDKALDKVFNYIKADFKILLVNDPDIQTLESAVREGFDVVTCEGNKIDIINEKLLKAEKRFMINQLRKV